MSTSESNSTPAPVAALNKVGLSRDDYKGSKTTLCLGCGHNSISSQIMSAFYQSNIDPTNVVKMSGIGCSSKLPAYFVSKAHGFNTVHGRMAPVATGVKVANHKLQMIGISGDGDTADIGIGGFVHLMRRNLPIAYIIANNGVYGLTKGQFSSTAEIGAKKKTGEFNPFEGIDLCSLALELGCSFVARSFSGDVKQMVTLVSAAMKHNGAAVIDVVSPCVTFNNHPESTMSYDYVKEHKVTLQELGIIEPTSDQKVDYAEGATQDVEMHDGSHLTLKKVDSRTHDVTNRQAALRLLHENRHTGQILTGLFYVDPNCKSLTDTLHLSDRPLALLQEPDLRPAASVLQSILDDFR